MEREVFSEKQFSKPALRDTTLTIVDGAAYRNKENGEYFIFECFADDINSDFVGVNYTIFDSNLNDKRMGHFLLDIDTFEISPEEFRLSNLKQLHYILQQDISQEVGFKNVNSLELLDFDAVVKDIREKNPNYAENIQQKEKQEKTQQRFFSPKQEERILSTIYTEHVIGENLLNTLYGKDRAFYDDISKQDGGGDPRTLEGAVNRLYQDKYDDYKKSIELRSQLELPDLHKLVYEHAEIDVNGHKRTCEHGLQQGFINAVKSNDALHKRNAQLEKENQQLREQLARNKPSKELEFEF